MNKYIIIDSKGKGYKSSFKYDLSIPSVFTVITVDSYDEARKFHFLRWANFRARRLALKDGQRYCVCIQTVDGKYQPINEHLTDDIIQAQHKSSAQAKAEIEEIITKWKHQKGLE